MEHFTPFEDDESRSSAHRIFEETYRDHTRQIKRARKSETPYSLWWELASELLEKLGSSALSALSSDYHSEQRLAEVVQETRDRIAATLAIEPELPKALVRLSDDAAVRFLTMHKSKGLEFHSVIVLGVENQTFWAKLAEERNVFFVGISRAKQRLVLTTADFRSRPKCAKNRWDERRSPHGEFVSHVTRHITHSARL